MVGMVIVQRGWRRWLQNGNVVVGHAGGSGVEYGRIVDEHYSAISLADCPGTTTHSFALGRLARENEHGPLVLVGHSFGASIVDNFATCPSDAAGLVFVEGVYEELRCEAESVDEPNVGCRIWEDQMRFRRE
jgi:hypothetical protein